MAFAFLGKLWVTLDDSKTKSDAFDFTYGTDPAGLDYYKNFVFSFTNINELIAWGYASKSYHFVSPDTAGDFDGSMETGYNPFYPKSISKLLGNTAFDNLSTPDRLIGYGDTNGTILGRLGNTGLLTFNICFWQGAFWLPAVFECDGTTTSSTTYDNGQPPSGSCHFGNQTVNLYGNAGSGDITVTSTALW